MYSNRRQTVKLRPNQHDNARSDSLLRPGVLLVLCLLQFFYFRTQFFQLIAYLSVLNLYLLQVVHDKVITFLTLCLVAIGVTAQDKGGEKLAESE